MARVSQTTQQIVRDGLVPVLTEPTVDGDIIDAGAVFLYVSNTTVSPINVTVLTPLTVDDLDVEELVVAVAAGAVSLIGPFPVRTFGQLAGVDKGRVYVDYSVQTDVDRAVVSF